MSTIRVHNVHPTVSKDEITAYFNSDTRVVASCSLTIAHDDPTKKIATVTFIKSNMAKSALALNNTTLGVASRESKIGIDDHFRGLTVVACGENLEIDVIAMHGLNGHAFNTWKENSGAPGGVMWLRDILPDQMPNARVMIYGYNASLISDASISRIQEHARLFVQSLQDCRRRDKTRRRVIFLCHSLGGIVLKQALVYIRNEPEYADLRGIPYGIIFLGTPHTGSGVASIGVTIANIARVAFPHPARQLVQSLEANSPALLDLSMSFRPLHSELQIVSFCEQRPMNVGFVLGRSIVIVDQTSAVMGIANERVIPVNRDHSDICKYSGVGDEVYKLVLSQLQRFVHEGVTLPLETRSLVRSPNSQNTAQPESQSDHTSPRLDGSYGPPLRNIPIQRPPSANLDRDHTVALIEASLQGNPILVQELLNFGANVNGMNGSGFAALHAAASSGHVETVDRLVRAGADLNMVTTHGWTPLHLATINGHEDVVRRLVSIPGINKYVAGGSDRCTPLQAASQIGQVGIAKILLEGIENGVVEREACSRALLSASSNGHTEIARMLLDVGTSTDFSNEDGFTPLQTAAQGGDLALVELLLARGSNPNTSNVHGFTPLHSAALNQHAEVVKRLLDAGADPNKASNSGFLALDAAVQGGSEDVVRYLLTTMGNGSNKGDT